MPANGPTIRGKPGPHVTRVGQSYNPETGITTQEIEYTGTQAGISGLVQNFGVRNREHRQDYEAGMARVVVSTPVQTASVLDKYEVNWEFEQREIWNHPVIRQAAIDYDSIVDGVSANYVDTFQKLAEDAVNGPISALASGDPVSGATFIEVVALLRAGIKNWEQEYISLRRTRTIPPDESGGCSVSAVSLIYTTEQLLVPATVAFQIPTDAQIAAFPNPDPTRLRWGWRRRPSTSTIQGQSNEQVSEFLLAMWPLLFNSASTGNADW